VFGARPADVVGGSGHEFTTVLQRHHSFSSTADIGATALSITELPHVQPRWGGSMLGPVVRWRPFDVDTVLYASPSPERVRFGTQPRG
jgi:hypothetical protein